MKRLISLVLLLTVIFTFCSCDILKENGETPVKNEHSSTPITVEEFQKELKLKTVDWSDIQSITRIIDNQVTIYEIKGTVREYAVTVRISDDDTDNISGIDIADTSNIFADYKNSIDDTSLDVHLIKEDNYVEASGQWNGFLFDIYTQEAIAFNDMNDLTVGILTVLISKDNFTENSTEQTT